MDVRNPRSPILSGKFLEPFADPLDAHTPPAAQAAHHRGGLLHGPPSHPHKPPELLNRRWQLPCGEPRSTCQSGPQRKTPGLDRTWAEPTSGLPHASPSIREDPATPRQSACQPIVRCGEPAIPADIAPRLRLNDELRRASHFRLRLCALYPDRNVNHWMKLETERDRYHFARADLTR
jgi:hypothetical protein